MKIFFGTVVRSASVREGGELVRLDWETKKIEAKVPIFPTNPGLEHDPNPRGNTRGCRGLHVWGKRLVATTYHTVRIFDFDLIHQRDISHGLMVGIHEVYGFEDKLWLSATAIDAVLECDLKTGDITNKFFPREMSPFQKAFNLTPLDIEKNNDQRCNYLGLEHVKHPSHLHLNAVSYWRGDIYALFNSFGAIVNLSQGEVSIEDPELKKGHNLLILENGIVVSNDTRNQTVRFYDLSTKKNVKIINLRKFPWVQQLAKIDRIKNIARRIGSKVGLNDTSKIAQPLFVRGLGLDTSGEYLFIGLSPASILCIDWQKEELVDAYNYSSNLVDCIHGLKIM